MAIASGSSIEAVLTLNASQFNQGLNSSLQAVEKFRTSFGKSVTPMANDLNKLKSSLRLLESSLEGATTIINKFNVSARGLSQFSTYATSVNKLANALKILSSDSISAEQSMNIINNMFKYFQNTLNGTEIKVKGVSNSIKELTNSERQNVSSANQDTTATQQLANAQNQLQAEERETSGAVNQATNSMNRQATASKGLGKAMSSLRMMGTMVGSMIAYNFVHNLAMATTETINAKSEMNGYFQMLGYTKSQVADFNQELDKTVQLFPRLNKYALGETISSIGVEFELSTAEMKKAMPVVSMITSEYLRAGRNVNEASLAVKDILQGEFQRLSRETGVKGEQLEATGLWSGDKSDVMGLLKALEKVGKDRNWDTFVTKANSLNDAVLIMQNRFGEWSADMVERFQPAIVGAFNMIMGTAQKFGGIINGVMDWLSGDGLDVQITQWALLGGAIATVGTALVSYRTGANLLQIAQMGLSKSIIATTLGLNGETTAYYGVRTAIYSKIFGLEAEKVAELSVKQAIASKVLGLDAEKVAQIGIKNTIIESSLAREVEKLKLEGATAKEIANTTALYENQLAHKSGIGVLTAHALRLDMTTYAQHGFTVALLEANTGMKASQITSMGVAKKMALLGTSMALPMGIVGAFAIALGTLALQMKDSAEQMAKFNDLLENGEEKCNDARQIVADYTTQQQNLEKQLSETKEGTIEYYEIQDKLRAVNQDLITSTQNLETTYSAYQKTVSAKKNYEKKLTDINIDHQHALQKAYMDAGYTASESFEMANDSMIDANNGAEQLRITLQKIAMLSGKGEQTINKLLDDFEESGVDKDVAKPYLTEAERLNKQAQAGLEKGMTDDSFMGRMDGWFSYYEAQVRNWINNVSAMVETGDWGKIFDNIWKGIAHGFADLPIIKDFWKWVYEQMGVDKLKGKGWQGLWDALWGTSPVNIFSKISLGSFLWNWVLNALNQLKTNVTNWLGSTWEWINDGLADWQKGAVDFLKPLDEFGDEVNKFLADPLGYLHIDLSGFDFFGKLFEGFTNNDGTGGGTGGFMKKIDISALLQGLFSLGDGIDFTQAWEWVNTNLISPISQALLTFISDPVSFIGNMGFSINGLLDALLGTDIFTNIWTWTYNNIVSPIGNAIWNGIQQIPLLGSILSLLGLLSDENIGASQKGRAIANWIGNGITAMISQIPIVSDILRMLGLIPQTEPDANSKGRGVGDNVKQGLKNGISGIANIVSTEMNNIIQAISQKADDVYNTAMDIGGKIVSGIQDAMGMHSPSIISREMMPQEFGVYIPDAIRSSGDTAYQSAYEYGQAIKDGISATTFNTTGFDSAVGVYQDDAQIVADSSQYMGVTTSTAFNDMSLAVNQTTSTMSGNVATTYNSMQQKQMTSLNSMKTQNLQAYNEMYLKSNQSLIQMRDSTSNVTHQMINAWDHMKNQIIASANKLKSDSTAHFNQLSSTIGSFYRKIQNPSNWGAGTGGTPTRSARHPTQGKSIARMMTRTATHHGAGASPYTNGTGRTMTLRALKNLICPSGDCSIFDGYDLNQKVNIDEFLSGIDGEHGFGWGDWSGKHYNHIKTTSDQWSMKSPTINLAGGIPTNADYKVGDFENGTPKISFGAFQSMAESIFSVIPYKFYYDSNWKGSWLGALQAGACNCSDGAEALIAFAEACGFSGYKQHTTTKGGIGHFYAVINGKAMDTTHFQNSGSWTPLGGAGIPTRSATPSAGVYPQGNKTVNVNVEISGTVYGVDDLDSKIQESVKQGLREEFNDPYTVAI